MMKYLGLIFILILGIDNLYKEQNYLEYHLEFRKIEEKIVNEEFNEAEILLEELFSIYEVKFVKDFVIAGEISLINGHKEKGINWIKNAIKKGATLECLREIKIFREQITLKEWSIIEEEYKILRKEYLSKIDLYLLRNLSKRYEEEQQSKRTELYKEIVTSNFENINDLIRKNKFPSEQLVGIDNKRLSKSIDDCELGNSKVIATLLHYDYPINEIGEEILKEAIKKGELHPREFAIIYNFEKEKHSVLYRKSKKEYEELAEYKFNFPFGEKIDNLERVNSDRAKFGICKYEIDLQKERIEDKYGIRLNFNYK